MPRKARIDAPGVLHHVIIRGIERKKIFRDDIDRGRFLERFGRVLVKAVGDGHEIVLFFSQGVAGSGLHSSLLHIALSRMNGLLPKTAYRMLSTRTPSK